MKEILENKAITLADGNQYYVIKKITHENELYLFCLNVTSEAKFALIKVKGKKAYFVKDEEKLSTVLNTLMQDKEYIKQVEDVLKQLKIDSKTKDDAKITKPAQTKTSKTAKSIK